MAPAESLAAGVGIGVLKRGVAAYLGVRRKPRGSGQTTRGLFSNHHMSEAGITNARCQDVACRSVPIDTKLIYCDYVFSNALTSERGTK